MTIDKRKVREGYNKAAPLYYKRFKRKVDPKHKDILDGVVQKLPRSAKVLDLGCGSGLRYTKYLAKRFETTGVDFSEEQIRLARINIPEAKFITEDITRISFPPETFNLITAFYSLIHIPISEQPNLLKNIYRWLKRGGYLLATMGHGKWEGKEENWLESGATMYWSHLGKEDNIKMIKESGFKIIKTAIDEDPLSAGVHLIVLARKEES